MPRWRSRSPRPGDGAFGRPAGRTPGRWRARYGPGGAAVTRPPEGGPVLLALARNAIAGAVGGDAGPGTFAPAGADVNAKTDAAQEDWLDAPGACFVTLTNAGRLRGCIGSIEPRRSLGADVRANAVAAATRDRRFGPVTAPEMPALAVEVSVLSPASPMSFADETDALAQLRPGVDGLVLECCGHRATYLPQVWDKLPDPGAFLASLKVKAGLPQNFWSDDLELSRYTVTEFHEPSPAGGES